MCVCVQTGVILKKILIFFLFFQAANHQIQKLQCCSPPEKVNYGKTDYI